MMIVHIKRNETPWETFTAPSEEQSLRMIREQYPKATQDSNPMPPDDRMPAEQIVHVYEAPLSAKPGPRLVARIREVS